MKIPLLLCYWPPTEDGRGATCAWQVRATILRRSGPSSHWVIIGHCSLLQIKELSNSLMFILDMFMVNPFFSNLKYYFLFLPEPLLLSFLINSFSKNMCLLIILILHNEIIGTYCMYPKSAEYRLSLS